MHNLLIQHIRPEGVIKTWHINCEQGPQSIGSSPNSQLRTSGEGLRGFQGVFEYNDGNWSYLNLDYSSDSPETTELLLTGNKEINVGNNKFLVIPFDQRPKLFQNSTNYNTQNQEAYQIITVHAENLLECKLIPLYQLKKKNNKLQMFKSSYDFLQNDILIKETPDWIYQKVGGLTVAQKTIFLEKKDSLKIFERQENVDPYGRKSLIATVIGASILGIFFLISPTNQDAGQAAKNYLPPHVTQEVRLTQPKKKKINIQQQQNQQQSQQVASASSPITPEKNNTQSMGNENKKSFLKSFSKSRISQMIGKISSTSSRSTNLITAQGITTGQAPSGSALSRLGSINQEGKNWGHEGKALGVQVSTQGIAGGKNLTGVGALSKGKTGSGGVGLLEDESEVVGGLDREIIAQYIKSQLGQILYCYERQLSANPNLYGKISVKFTIGANGGVETQQISESSMKNASVESCVLNKVSKWQFQKPEGGTKVVVTYPFLFKTTQ